MGSAILSPEMDLFYRSGDSRDPVIKLWKVEHTPSATVEITFNFTCLSGPKLFHRH